VDSVEDEVTISQEDETQSKAEIEFNHDYDLIRGYAEQLNGEVESGEE
jgi:hypothetical protein